MVFTISIPLTEIGVKGTWCCEERRICRAQCTTCQDLDNIIIRDGTEKHQHNVGVEGEVRKTQKRLKGCTERMKCNNVAGTLKKSP